MAKSKAEKQREALVKGLQNGLSGRVILLQGTAKQACFFGGGKAGAELIRKGTDEGYLERAPAPRSADKKTQQKPHARLTEKGRELLLNELTPKQILEELMPIIRELEGRLTGETSPPASQGPEKELSRGVNEDLMPVVEQILESGRDGLQKKLEQELQKGYDTLSKKVEKVAQAGYEKLQTTLETRLDKPLQELEATLHQSLTQLNNDEEPSDQDQLIRVLQTTQHAIQRVSSELAAFVSDDADSAPASETSALNVAWEDDVLRMVEEQRQRNPHVQLSFPELYAELKRSYGNLTIPEFHLGLRELHEQKKITLLAFTRALITIDDPENALYLDREVKYYVR